MIRSNSWFAMDDPAVRTSAQFVWDESWMVIADTKTRHSPAVQFYPVRPKRREEIPISRVLPRVLEPA